MLGKTSRYSILVVSNNFYRCILYGDVYRIPFHLSTYNPESIADRLSEETYEIKVHILASNSTAASQPSRIGRLLWDNTDLLIFVLACLIVTIICLLIYKILTWSLSDCVCQLLVNLVNT
ncbi:hypothetical protein EB796_010291 [Bugula neritina]|uniref:Uncharacterized protein n=1 Tax=Bugula neritina TaxID=10212 RepID=A0A7J7JZU0_BUGNE|nr:hypothetical protein EB796_010291 [Bugula neritina]